MSLALDRRLFLGLLGAGAASGLLPAWARAATPFNFQASWINDAEFMGYFLALDKGYYADEGLELTYQSGGPDVIPESTLITARADLTLTTPDTTIKAITEQGAPFRIIGAQYQKNPIGVVSLAKTPINEPRDLIGKTLAVPPVNVISVEAMLAANGIDKAQVNIVPYAYDPTPLIQGEIDASVDFTTNVPYTIELAGEEATSFLLYDYGYTVFNDTVVVTEDTLASRRDDLVKFLRASRKGWNENFADPAALPPAYADTWFKGTGRAVENEVYFNTAQQPLMEAEGGIFSMSEEAIAANIEALNAVGIKATRDHFDTTLLDEI
ncbi:ABC transporter substrate-binding protein [Falsirhodobacter halotolerans]|uniref:ABC transporter substrate-binding protein n=1 Tax=Falsirhodobacter halotolerans TaxID=1146892 RepID=UPI001FD0CD2C|nr:ABC transporter substrate-binding protein [Falsirhodobacter halotolerans]MCJ8140645.1 ABC transporter substrate-binding protein [Falsirhodobacter halotolerans]